RGCELSGGSVARHGHARRATSGASFLHSLCMTMRATASRVSVALALIYLGAAPAHAQIYRWLDGNGAMMYSTDRPADPGALKEFTVIDPVTRPPTSTLPADTIAQEPPRLQIERDTGATGASAV